MYTFELPEIGEGVLEGEVVKWLVSEGDVVVQDQPVCEVMTDKANVEISVRDGGKVLKLYAEEGDVVKIHSPLMDIDESSAGTSAPKAAPAPARTLEQDQRGRVSNGLQSAKRQCSHFKHSGLVKA